jgi:hypothetical protein
VTLALPLLVAAAVAAGLARRARRRLVRAALAGVALLLGLAGGYDLWYHHRPVPPPAEERLFRGVVYTRDIRPSPRPLVVHVVTVDLADPAVRFLVTPPDAADGHPLRARTTSAFLREYRCQVAVNGAFFFPWHARGPLDYYPHAGDPVSPRGLAVSAGRGYSSAEPGLYTLFLGAGNRAAIGAAFDRPEHAVSGRDVIVRGGKPAGRYGSDQAPDEPHPRTAVALDAAGTRLLVVVVDGRQPNYSEGVTLPELADLVIGFGGWTALNLDGGGSSTLVAEGPGGRPRVLNSPIHGRHPPGRERPVANHLGVYAARG